MFAMYRKLYDFEFNLEFICRSEFFRKYQNLSISFEFSEKPTSASKFQIEQEKSYSFLLIIHMKKF